MSKISVSVTDGTNVNLTVSPRPVQTITVSRGSTGTGTVTAVTANTPLSVTNGTTTPDLSISQANASTAGYLTAGDWSTFNSKVSTVSGTAPVTVTGTANAIVSMAAATDSVSGYLTSTDHATFNAKVGSITSADGSIAVTGTTTRDLSVASSPNVIVEVRNNTGATLTKGTAVYINGAIGQLPTVTKAQANSDAASAQTLGLMTTDLANNANGYVTIIGLVTNVNTSAYTDGQQLYLSPTVAGGLTATKPSAPQHLVYMAIVEHAHITQGKLFVKVQNGYELDELHDVQIISPTNGQTLTYDSATSLWKNTTPAASGVTSVSGTGTVSGISLSGTVTSTGSLTLGGSLNLSSPPAIGGTTPNTITGSSITSYSYINAVDDGTGNAYIQLDTYNNDGFVTIINSTGIYKTDYTDNYPISFPAGISVPNITSTFLGQYNVYPSSSVRWQTLAGAQNTVDVKSPTSAIPTSYTLYLPTTAGSANQVLKTDGSGNLDWTTVGSSPITYTGTTDPTAPTGTDTKLYSKSFGGYPTLAARNALNTSFGLQSALWSKNIQMWTCTNSSAGAWINQTAASSGTFTAVTPTTGSTLYQTIRRSTYANVITNTNQVLGVNGVYLSFFRGSVAGQGGFFFYTRCGFDVWTNGGRFFAGMALNNTTIVSNDPSSNNNTVGFCVDAADNGAISFLTRGTAATKASTGYTITSNKGYELYIYCSPNSSQYTWMIVDINAGTSATGTATANLPTNTQTQQPTVLASNAALTAATAISLGIAKIYCESDY